MNNDFIKALSEARQHALERLKERPFDPVYRFTLDQLEVIDDSLSKDGNLSGLRSGQITLGRMAAKELGNDEAVFAHSLHVIQWEADSVTGDNAVNRLT